MGHPERSAKVVSIRTGRPTGDLGFEEVSPELDRIRDAQIGIDAIRDALATQDYRLTDAEALYRGVKENLPDAPVPPGSREALELLTLAAKMRSLERQLEDGSRLTSLRARVATLANCESTALELAGKRRYGIAASALYLDPRVCVPIDSFEMRILASLQGNRMPKALDLSSLGALCDSAPLCELGAKWFTAPPTDRIQAIEELRTAAESTGLSLFKSGLNHLIAKGSRAPVSKAELIDAGNRRIPEEVHLFLRDIRSGLASRSPALPVRLKKAFEVLDFGAQRAAINHALVEAGKTSPHLQRGVVALMEFLSDLLNSTTSSHGVARLGGSLVQMSPHALPPYAVASPSELEEIFALALQWSFDELTPFPGHLDLSECNDVPEVGLQTFGAAGIFLRERMPLDLASAWPIEDDWLPLRFPLAFASFHSEASILALGVKKEEDLPLLVGMWLELAARDASAQSRA
jgi:hypothetical protein